MRCRSLADRSFSASLPSSRELRVGSPCDNAKPQGNHLTANAVGKLKAIDGSFAQERCLRGLGTRETDHEREQIRDVIGRMTAPNGLEPRQARRTQVAAATWSCRSDTCKLRHAKRTARLGNVQSGIRPHLRVAMSLHLRVDDVARQMVCHRSSEHPATQGVLTGLHHQS